MALAVAIQHDMYIYICVPSFRPARICKNLACNFALARKYCASRRVVRAKTGTQTLEIQMGLPHGSFWLQRLPIGSLCLSKRLFEAAFVFDDVILMSRNQLEFTKVIAELRTKLDVHDFGRLHSFLGIVFRTGSYGAYLSHSHYVEELLQRFNMHNAKSVNTLMTTASVFIESSPCNQGIYREIIGSLTFLCSRTRPEISTNVGILSRKVSNPDSNDMMAAKRILRYLQKTKHFVL